MAVKETRLAGHIMLPSEEAYNTLVTTGKYEQDGVEITYDPETTIYITPTTGGSGAGLTANTAVVTDGNGKLVNSGVTSTEIGFLSDARSNLQEQIDAIDAKIGTGTGNYFADTFAEIDYTKPGNWYVPDGTGTYYHGVVDDDGKFKMVAAGVKPEEIGSTDLSAYQKKTDTSISVYDTTTTKVSTVVGGLNTLESKIGFGWPLATTNQTIAAAINELANSGGGGTGTVTIDGTAGISTKKNIDGSYSIMHSNNFVAQNVGSATHGRCIIPIPMRVDAQGHVNVTASTLSTLYIPTTAGSNGQVWMYDAATNKGVWGTAGGSYTLPAATTSTLGGVKVGTGLAVNTDGTLYTSLTSENMFHTAASGTTSRLDVLLKAYETRIAALEAKIATFSYDATSETLSISVP